MQRLLIDECCDAAIAEALREAGHDVSVVGKRMPGANDETVLAWAEGERRTLVTEDKDFGWLVYARAHESAGVVLVRWPGNARAAAPAAVLDAVAVLGADLVGAFVVVEPGRVRVSRTP